MENQQTTYQLTSLNMPLIATLFALELLKLYQTVWHTNMIPNDWGHSKLVALWKGPSKGKSNDPSSYRGLQIGSTFCKIMVMIIINRWRSWYEDQLMDQQQGFRRARGTTDGIFIVKRVQQITEKMKKKQYMLFLLTSAQHLITLEENGCSNQ